MKIPDKIYLHGYDFSENPVKSWSEKQTDGIKGHKAINVEYIRKDALLELLKSEKDPLFCDDYERGCIDGRNGLVEELLNKLNKM